MPHYYALGDQKIGTFQRSRKAKKLNSSTVTFQGHLCAVAMASASMMSEAVKNKALDEIATIRETFTAMMRGSDSTSLGELDALRSVRRYRVRVRCALLPWEALQEACNAA
jgi:nitrogen fixation NifU-like protein